LDDAVLREIPELIGLELYLIRPSNLERFPAPLAFELSRSRYFYSTALPGPSKSRAVKVSIRTLRPCLPFRRGRTQETASAQQDNYFLVSNYSQPLATVASFFGHERSFDLLVMTHGCCRFEDPGDQPGRLDCSESECRNRSYRNETRISDSDLAR
jgi:hypothetical protein